MQARSEELELWQIETPYRGKPRIKRLKSTSEYAVEVTGGRFGEVAIFPPEGFYRAVCDGKIVLADYDISEEDLKSFKKQVKFKNYFDLAVKTLKEKNRLPMEKPWKRFLEKEYAHLVPKKRK